MKKHILLSIKSEHLINILNGEKTLELRKTIPSDYKGWVYLYCTKAEPLLGYEYVTTDDDGYGGGSGFCYSLQVDIDDFDILEHLLNGKVVARFWFDEYDFIGYGDTGYYEPAPTFEDDNETHLVECGDDYFITNDQVNKTYLSIEEIKNYGKGKSLYAWKIKDLEIFNQPMNLRDFAVWNYKKFNVDGTHYFSLTKAPQSWQYVFIK